MNFKQSILETIGNTPMVRLNRIVADVPATVLMKVETFNPGHSIKDRMALKMLEDAEANGDIKPGGTIIECTSGNTGMGLAIAGAVKGYRCIFTTNDKQSKEKIDLLKALGAEVVVCPTNVTPEDPRSYYSVAERLSKEIPNSFWFNQYDNLSNRQAHYESTGPEIWEQTGGKITHLVVGVGTGGTISGTGKYLKEQNPDIKVWGIDTYGSVFKKYHETGEFDEKEIYPYITEGIGEDILPKNVDFSIIDHFEKVTDKDGALYARKLAREEGILLGYSAGSAMAGLLQMKDQLTADDVVVIVIHDHGSRYVGKIYNDDWMRERGFLDTELRVKDILAKKKDKQFFSVSASETVRQAFAVMKEHDISQMPVMKDEEVVGSITENIVLNYLLDNPFNHSEKTVETIMGDPFPLVNSDMPFSQLNHYINKSTPAVLVKDTAGTLHVVTKYDIIQAL
ncbi:pyridoxal-phosphate dependent enzyme [Flavilitoribacter nigricans]|uniref:Cystathionine beta-synthase n=1 Tax=Flavilitoribacter nigricans (strain ATCC 23147 / DSM 23189 / NBRC 102662 / NCIMB 1420 / SS-2) TaxID=1122177 RepID=A0A2D0N9F4_FLAN2|nr:pyridoxal-phosphate dependent enzyme [Flavilitoribacter nigricans]PHN05018.1 cystathionine beta-synthase [Flavilitoribacter nigricans DSM 23189 = NBRC 102662]